MWKQPLGMIDGTGRIVSIDTLEAAGREIQLRWETMPKAERAAAYRAMVVEANGGNKGTAREAVLAALIASGMRAVDQAR